MSAEVSTYTRVTSLLSRNDLSIYICFEEVLVFIDLQDTHNYSKQNLFHNISKHLCLLYTP